MASKQTGYLYKSYISLNRLNLKSIINVSHRYMATVNFIFTDDLLQFSQHCFIANAYILIKLPKFMLSWCMSEFFSDSQKLQKCFSITKGYHQTLKLFALSS